MTVHLPQEVESSIQAAVRSGHFASLDDAMAEAARLLLRDLEDKPGAQADRAKGKPSPRRARGGGMAAMSEDAFLKHLVAAGLMSRLPDRDADFDDPDDQPVSIQGEPLSETVIRERR